MLLIISLRWGKMTFSNLKTGFSCAFVLASGFLFSGSGAALAEDSIALPGVTVTATRVARSIADVPETVVVIERDEIQKQLAASSDPADALAKLIPGYSVSNQSLSNASETFRGRGVLVLVDGIRRNTPLRNVSRITSLIDLNMVERIEVVAGSSSIYGSGATGGTINFITKQGQEGKPVVTVSTAVRAFTADIGASLAPETSVTVSGKKGNTNYFASLTGRRTGRTFDGAGDELPSDPMLGQGGADRLKYANGRVGLGHEVGSKTFNVSAEWTYADQKPKYFSDYSATPIKPDYSNPYNRESVNENSKYFAGGYKDSNFVLGSLAFDVFHNDVEKRFGFTELSPANTLVYYTGGADPFGDNQTILNSRRTGSKLTIDSSLDSIIPGMRVTWGGDVSYDETSQTLLSGRDAIAPMEQTNYAGFAQVEVPVGSKIKVRGGVRHEKFDLTVKDFHRPAVAQLAGATTYFLPGVDVKGGDFDYDATTYNLGAVVQLTQNLRVHGNFSQGFELPDVGAFTRRAMNANPFDPSPVDFSSIAPKAQLVNSYEIGLNGQLNKVKYSLTGFVTTSEEGITFDTVSQTLSQQKERIHGVEATIDYVVSDAMKVGAVLAYREGKYDTDDDGDVDTYLPNNRIATPFRGLAYVSYQFDTGLSLRGEVEFFSGRGHEDTGLSREYDIEGAVTANILGSYPLGDGKLTFAARNLMDLEYENPTATATRNLPINANGRTISIGYSLKF